MFTTYGASVFDRLRSLWERPLVMRRLSLALIAVFMAGIACILLKKAGLLPEPVARMTPDSTFYAIQVAFSLVLAIEVVQLIFAVADSVSRAVGKQLEIMALILLRDAFKDISLLHGPVNMAQDYGILLQIMASIVAALLLFICLGVYVRLYRLHGYIRNSREMRRYINAKKCISLLLAAVFVAAGVNDLYGVFVLGHTPAFFLVFYTSLIFTDILLVLVGQYFMPSFHATFRNSGYAAATLVMRIALGAPHYAGAVLCVFAGLYVLGLTWATARFLPEVVLPENAPHKGPPIIAQQPDLPETSEETPCAGAEKHPEQSGPASGAGSSGPEQSRSGPAHPCAGLGASCDTSCAASGGPPVRRCARRKGVRGPILPPAPRRAT